MIKRVSREAVALLSIVLAYSFPAVRAEGLDEYESAIAVRQDVLEFATLSQYRGTNRQVNAKDLNLRANEIIKKFESLAEGHEWEIALQKMMLFPDRQEAFLLGLMRAYSTKGDHDKAFMVFMLEGKRRKNQPAIIETARLSLLGAKDPNLIVEGYIWMKGRGALKFPSTYKRNLLQKTALAYEELHKPGEAAKLREERRKLVDELEQNGAE